MKNSILNSKLNLLNEKLSWLLAVVISILVITPAFCGNPLSLTHSGHGCIGDSLKLNAGDGVTKIVWTWDTSTIKTGTYTPKAAGYGITVAGNKAGTVGSDSMHLDYPYGMSLDAAGNIYVADFDNNRVQKWAPGAKYGTTVAGNKAGASGSDSLHLNEPADVYVDAQGNIYIADFGNNRIQKWAHGAKYGVTVAGNKFGTSGSDSLHFDGPSGVFLDASNNIYVADQNNNRVQKWAAGVKYGTTVATNLSYPTKLYIDKKNNIYITDSHNNRVQEWKSGTKYGITVAGDSTGSSGSSAYLLSNPEGVCVDANGNIFVGDNFNDRVQKWAPGATSGTTVAGITGNSGTDSLQLHHTSAVSLDANGNIYVVDILNNRVQKWGYTTNVSDYYIANKSGSYYATVYYTSGNVVNTDTISINPQPTAFAGAPQEICAAGNATIIGPSSLSTNNSYSWTSSPSGFTSTLGNPIVAPTATTTYTLTISNTLSGCTSAASSVQVSLGTPMSTPYGTYFGGNNGATSNSITRDIFGNTYITGYTASTSGITTKSAYQTSYGGGTYDAFLAKFNCSGGLEWATYYGGNGEDEGNSVYTDDSGNAYITGLTFSSSGIATSGAFKTSFSGSSTNSNAFLAKFNSGGSLLWGTYYGAGGPEVGNGVVTDKTGNVYFTGQTYSSSGIATSGAYQTTIGGNYDAFIAKFNSSGNRIWATYYGGFDTDFGEGLTLDGNNNIYFIGSTSSNSGIATTGAHNTSYMGNYDAYIAKFTYSGAIVWGTYYGGLYSDYGSKITADANNNIYVTGYTISVSGIATAGAYQTSINGSNPDAFLAKFTSAGVLTWGTYYGGSGTDYVSGVTTDANNNVYFTGQTSSATAIATAGAYQTAYSGSVYDAYLVKFSNGGARLYATYYGTQTSGSGISVDNSGNTYFTGNAGTIVATSGAYQTNNGGNQDAYLAKLYITPCSLSPSITGKDTQCQNATAYYSATKNGSNYSWKAIGGGILSGKSADTVSVSWTRTGSDTLWLYETSGTCKDSTKSIILVNPIPTAYAGNPQEICQAGNATIIGPSALAANNSYSWISSPSGFTSTLSNPVVAPTTNTQYILTITNAGCLSKSDTVQVSLGTPMSTPYGTYFGGAGQDNGTSIARDKFGNTYIMGTTYSTSGIATKGAYQTNNGGGGNADAFLAKFNCSGGLEWATYYGGSALEEGLWVTTDDSGNVYITGYTWSATGIATKGAYQTSLAGGGYDAFIAKFNGGGSLLWATYYGGSGIDFGSSILTDKTGNVYFSGTTSSTSGIATSGAYKTSATGGYNAFIAKFNSGGSRLWATYYGGGGLTYGQAIALDSTGNLLMTGMTNSTTGIATSGAYQTSNAGGTYDAYLAKFNNSGTTLQWATYYGGGNEEYTNGVATDGANVYITGGTMSTSGIATSGAYQSSYGGGTNYGDAFLTKFNSSGSIQWATYYGGSSDDEGYGINADGNGNIYLSGMTYSTGMATNGAFQSSLNGSFDAFLAKFSSAGARQYGSYYGNSPVAYSLSLDNSGDVFFTGYVANGIPATSGAYQTAYKGGSGDAFLAKINIAYNDAGIDSFESPGSPICVGDYNVKAVLKNYGQATLTSATVNWTYDGFAETAAKWTGSLATGGTAIVQLATSTFSNPGKTYLVAWTSLPNGVTDSASYNDTGKTTITVNGLPTANAGNTATICYGSSVSIGSSSSYTTHTYAWASNPSGYTSTSANPSVSPTVTTTYTLTETITTTGCTKSNSVVITVNPLPTAKAGNNTIICYGNSTYIGSTAISGDTYSWASNPSGFTSTLSNPYVSPTSTTTYTLTETITATGCSKSNPVIITVNSLPSANAGSNATICYGNSTGIGATAISGDIYSWVSGPSGYASTASNPTVNPTVTTTYYLTETITNTGCSNTDSVIVTVSPLPAAQTANSQAICLNNSLNIGSMAITGDTYSWASNPSGFSSTLSNPTASPTSTTTYTLTETITATGCSKSNPVIITVNSLPLANAGGNATICYGNSTGIGATATSGDTYSWASSPLGYASTTSSPTVNPTVTTTYYLTETITNTGCSNADSVVVTVNPLPAAQTTNSQAICLNNSLNIGSTAVSGDAYSWASNPSGFSSTLSNPTASPTTATTYTLTETITATGCSKSNPVTITVNSLPLANAGGNATICYGNSTGIGATATSGDTYSWASSPLGYASTASNPTVNPTVTTTYYLTETITNTGCNKTDSVMVTVNPLPAAQTTNSQAICLNNSLNIGSTAIAGDTYSWASSPSGFTSTLSNPSASPTMTTTYYLTETITATGCNKTDSVVITVNPLPSATTGASKAICFGGNTPIGALAVSGDTYAWVSNPSGYTSTASHAIVSPTITTTYYLTETITATGCFNADSITITVNPLPVANAGNTQTVCADSAISIGATAVSGNTYSWTSSPTGFTSALSSPTVIPTITTVYTLVETITATGCSNANAVTINVNPLPPAFTGKNKAVCVGYSAQLGKAPVTGDTYNWYSNPAGFSSTASNPTIFPTASGAYYLTEVITLTGCHKTDSVIVYLKPPAITGGNRPLCTGDSIQLGDSAIGDDEYIWWSSPAGFSDTTSAPYISPTVTTTYYLTETVRLGGCNKTDTAIITVNPVPVPNAGSPQTSCAGSSVSIGATVKPGDSYSWASNPPGFADTTANPTVSPTTTTVYYVTETITATGCHKTDSVLVTVNPLPLANTGNNTAICFGTSASIGDTAVVGDNYSWTSSPTGYNNSASNPTVNPTLTTTYYLTETITPTGCTHSDSVIITVNPLPAANAGNNTAICFGANTSIGSTAINGDAYSWTSNPSGFADTSSNPTVAPTLTTTYYLTETITNTGCIHSDSVIITVNPLPAANAGTNAPICFGANTYIGSTAVISDTYSWTSSPSGFADTTANPTVVPTITTTYYLTETITATGCTKSDSVIVIVNPLPAANAGTNTAICFGANTSIGSTAMSGDTYLWTSNPSGYSDTTASPTVAPTITTIYYLTETITNTGCTQSDSVIVTVNPLPVANAGTNTAICFAANTSIGATAVIGDNYSWTSNPSGFADTSSNPTVAPTLTTTYYLTETITNTGCIKSDSVIITVNPLPVANAGSNTAICFGTNTSIGATAVIGDTYSWISNPSGFADTTANPTVAPTLTTVYYLTETITTTGCTHSDSVIITVNPLPVANAGSSTAICFGTNTSIGSTAINGDTYSWTSNPSGFTDTSSNPTVAPTLTTTYYLTETIMNTGCNKSDSVIITVNPLPLANAGNNTAICFGTNTSIGSTAVIGDTYSWTSNPSGLTDTSSNATISPTITTTYYLTETITATGCNKTDSVIITVNPLPIANAGINSTICFGTNTFVGSTAVSGDAYSWISNPSGFADTSSNPTISPTITTTYYLTETITNTGCTHSDSVVITVNPLPSANAGNNTAICFGTNTFIGATAVIGDTYFWSANPSGFADTSSNPTVAPTVTTTYYLTETITSTGCNKTDSVVVTVNPLPLANTGSNSAICFGSGASIGSTTVLGDTYLWSSSPSGFTDTTANPTVSPTIAATYYLTETITNTGCTHSDSVVITVNPLPAANAGNSAAICFGNSAPIGDTAVIGNTFSWVSNPSGYNDTSSVATVAPAITTTYYLTETITATGCNKTDSVIITVNPLPLAIVGKNQAICLGGSAAIGDTATIGHTYSWTSNPLGFTSTNAGPSPAPTVMVTYYLTEQITATGCSNSDSVIVSVNPIPTAKAGANKQVCFGNAVSIGDTSITGYKYQWKSSPTGYTDTIANPTVSPTITTTYYLAVTNSFGCKASDSLVVTVDSLPIVSAGNNDTVQQGDSAFMLTGFSPAGGKWHGRGVDSTGNFTPSVAGIGNDTLTYSYANSSGCSASSTIIIKVNSGGEIGVDAGINEILSPLGNILPDYYPIIVHLMNFGSVHLNYAEIHWQVNNVSQPVTYWNGSLGKDSSDLVTLASKYDFTKIGSYTIKAWTANPDSSTDINHKNDTTEETTNIFYLGIAQQQAGNNIKVWYSADDEKAHIEINSTGNEQVTVQLTDIQGKVLHKQPITLQTGLNQSQIDMAGYASGVYLVFVQGNTIIDTRKIIKE